MKRLFLLTFFLVSQLLISQNIKQELRDALKNQDSDKIIVLATKLLEKHPNDPELLFYLGKTHTDLKEFDKAIPYLEKAFEKLNVDWQKAWLHNSIIEAYFSTGQKDLALKHYKKYKDFKGTKNSNNHFKQIGLSFGFDDIYKDWKIIETHNIIFHFQDASSIKNIDFYVKSREDAFIEINSFFNSKLLKKIDFFVWKDVDKAEKIFKHTLGFTKPEYCVSHNHSKQTPGHEITHSISYWISNDKVIKNRFINEGIAVCFDQDTDKLEVAKKVFDVKTTSIETLWKNPQGYPESILYPIAGVFVSELVNFNKEKFLMLCKNQTFENAQQIYGNELQNLINLIENKLSE